jgi:SAM-dependent MidA family methyltransferase
MSVSPLARLLAERIREHGPITVADYMAAALGHPEHGYYMGRDPFGRGGDFTTAPEISQMFGEIVGLWCVVVWQMMGQPGRVVLVELGPGRGTLMSDILRAAATVPAFGKAAEIHLVETSPTLRARQRETLKGVEVAWHERFEQVPDGPLLLVANELFDALPIRQYEKRQGLWHERLIGLDTAGGLAFVLGPEAGPDVAPGVRDAPDGSLAEVCEAGRALAAALADRIARHGGAALIIDYGPAASAPGDSLQAVRSHQYHPVLETPGEADLTAHVDFQALAESARTARVWGPLAQGELLMRLGITARAGILARSGGPEVVADVTRQLRRLIDPAEMGTLFKTLAITHPALPPPPGFERLS